MKKCTLQRFVLATCVICLLGLIHRQHRSIKMDDLVDIAFRRSVAMPQIVQSNRPRRTQIRLNYSANSSEFSHPLENSCKYPVIYTDEKDLLPYVEHYREVRCVGDQPNLVSMDSEGYIYVHKEFDKERQKKVPKFACFYRAITGSLFPNVTQFTWKGEQHEVCFSSRGIFDTVTMLNIKN